MYHWQSSSPVCRGDLVRNVSAILAKADGGIREISGENGGNTLQERLVMKQPVERFQDERGEREVADLLRLEVPAELLEPVVLFKCGVQSFEDQHVAV